MRAQSDQSNS